MKRDRERRRSGYGGGDGGGGGASGDVGDDDDVVMVKRAKTDHNWKRKGHSDPDEFSTTMLKELATSTSSDGSLVVGEWKVMNELGRGFCGIVCAAVHQRNRTRKVLCLC